MSGVAKLMAVRTHFSLGESVLTPKKIVEECKTIGASTVVITDTMTVSALIEMAKAAGDSVRPIFGCRLRVVPDASIQEKNSGEIAFYPKVYPRNKDGMKELMAMLSRAFQEDHFYSVPRLSLCDFYELIASENLFVSTGDMEPVFHAQNHSDIMREIVSVARERAWVEICIAPTMYHETMTIHALRAIKEHSLKALITFPTFYSRGGFEAYLTNMGIQLKSSADKPYTLRDPAEKEFWPLTDSELVSKMGSHFKCVKARYDEADMSVFKSALVETGRFCDQIEYKWEKEDISLPTIAADPAKALLAHCYDGMKDRLFKPVFGYTPSKDDIREKYIPRLKYEYDVLTSMGFSDYFLLVGDVVKWSKENEIAVGPGRGSVGGSLVAFLMGITDIDPIRFDLLFERFINPSRNDLPDADLDFMSERREDVIKYLEQKYGEDYVAGISNYSMLGAASSLSDVGRVHAVDQYEIKAVTKQIPETHGITADLAAAREQSADMAIFATKYPDTFRVAESLQNTMRSYGKHAAGVVVASDKLVNRSVVEVRNGQRSINWDKRVSEDMGLVKLDILGLSTLDIIKGCVDNIRKRHGIDFDIMSIPLDDEKTLDAFTEGRTKGVFQMEGGGAKRILKDMGSTSRLSFDDVIATNALNRPGPIDAGLVERYVKRRSGDESVEFPHPKAEDALAPTYGVIVYQEQVMRIATDLAGYSLSEADFLRKAMGKKDPVAMAAHRDKFVTGCVTESGMTERESNQLFDTIEVFAGYAFNKSHSAAYAIIGFICMWLKEHYSTEFFAASLSVSKEDKLKAIVKDAESYGITLMPPDINKSTEIFEISDDHTLLTPLSRVKGVTEKSLQAILQLREESPLTDADSTLERLTEAKLRRVCRANQIEALRKVGAFAGYDPNELPADHHTRLKDQITLIPGLITKTLAVTEPMKVTPVAEKLNELIEEYKAVENDPECVDIYTGKKPYFFMVYDCPTQGDVAKGKMVAGRGFDYCLTALNEHELKKTQGYYTALIKRPKADMSVSAEEIGLYQDFLKREIELMQPKLIIAAGSQAAKFFIPSLKGSMIDHAGTTHFLPEYDATLIIGFTPGMIYHDPDKQILLNDIFGIVREMIS